MPTMWLSVKRVRPSAILPSRAYDEAAGLDLYAADERVIAAGKVEAVPAGIATEFGRDFSATIHDRSGMGARGLHVFGGVIDPDYRGEWSVLVYNSQKVDYLVKVGDRIAQAIFHHRLAPVVQEVEELGQSWRGERGFGSSGA